MNELKTLSIHFGGLVPQRLIPSIVTHSAAQVLVSHRQRLRNFRPAEERQRDVRGGRKKATLRDAAGTRLDKEYSTITTRGMGQGNC